jgi:hypothetical protein
MFNMREKMGKFVTRYPHTTTVLISVGVTLGIAFVLSCMMPTHDAFAVLIKKTMWYPMITILHGGHIMVHHHQ